MKHLMLLNDPEAEGGTTGWLARNTPIKAQKAEDTAGN